MPSRVRPPLYLIVAALIALLGVLATLQYRWLGRISDAERDSRRSLLGARARAFASDFDKELTLAYVVFQFEAVLKPAVTVEHGDAGFAARYDRWQSTARFPRLIKDCFVATLDDAGALRLRRFNPAGRSLEPAEWPPALAGMRGEFATIREAPVTSEGPGGTLIVRRLPAVVWGDVPALVVPMPLVLLDAAKERPQARHVPSVSFAVLVLDREYMTRDMLPALRSQHLRELGDGVEYHIAVVNVDPEGPVYRSTAEFDPTSNTKVDATADVFQVRLQEFAQMAADVRRFSMALAPGQGQHTITAVTRLAEGGAAAAPPDSAGVDVRGEKALVMPEGAASVRARAIVTSVGAASRAGVSPARWRVLVKHPSGSLEAAVNSTRRRNLIVSFGILGVLGASMGLLVLSVRRSQALVRQQMEFVAGVSHELRTPLAVIRSAGDNLAAGVVGDDQQIKQYGELVRREGQRLSEMVEQILEFAGIQSGQRRFEPVRVDVGRLLEDVLFASATLLEAGGVQVEVDLQANLPAVLGNQPALRRVFQNLVGNAIKYGAEARWVGVRARESGGDVVVTIADRGRGIAPAELGRIFDPFYRTADVIAAQIQGAGLGLSLVHRIVQAHGGHVTVKSAPGEGSEFAVHLPAGGPEPVAGRDPRAAQAPHYS